MNEIGSKGLLKESEWLSLMGVQADFSFFLSGFIGDRIDVYLFGNTTTDWGKLCR